MRCPKCGYISFDYVNNCEKCGKDLKEVAFVLGPFIMENQGASWFEVPDRQEVEKQTDNELFDTVSVPEPETAPLDLRDIDVSDLISDEMPMDVVDDGEEVEVFDSDIIETAVVDEDFQKALDDVITE